MMFAKSNWITKLVLYSVLLLVLIYVLLTSILPLVAVPYAERWFADQHPGQVFTLQSVEISPLRGRVTLKDLQLYQPQQGTIEQLESVSLGSLQLHWQPMALFKKQILAELQVSNLNVKAYNLPAVGFEQLFLTGVDVTEQSQQVSRLALSGLLIKGINHETTEADQKPLLKLNQYQIDDLRFDAQAFQLATGLHRYNGLVMQLTKLADGTFQGVPIASAAVTSDGEQPTNSDGVSDISSGGDFIDEHAASSARADAEGTIASQAIPETQLPAPPSTDTPEKAPAKTFSVQIAGLQQSANSVSYLRFTDHSVTPAARVHLAIRSVDIGAVDSNQLQQTTPLQIELALDEYNRIVASGEVGLVNNQPQGGIELHVEQLNLVPFNGYVSQATGYHVQKGVVKLDVNLAIHNAKMDGQADILLRNSEFLPVDEETIDRVGKQISMPLDTVLSILRDDNNNIELSMPLSGNINDPDVGLDDLMHQLSILALEQAMTYYLKQALQPYSTLISLSTYAGDYLFAIRLDDLSYQPFVSQINEDQIQYLNKVAEMMTDEETLELHVCGFASDAEVQALAEQPAKVVLHNVSNWRQLAQKRSGNIKAWFKEQHQELLPRVTTCQPQKGEEAVVSMGF